MGYLGRSPTPSPIDTSDIPANSIDASKIIDGSIELAEIADNSITDAKLNSSKLDGIEASADVTDTVNVTSSGALMDSEVTNLAAVKAFATTDYATSAQGTTADAALPLAGGTITGDLAIDGDTTLSAYNNTTAITGNAVDVFIYDTSNDSDGGAWRKRTQATSWYNETLNTSTRGARKEFPSVAVIVATNDSVIIYDGDTPDLDMWMVFDKNAEDMLGGHTASGGSWLSGVSAVNGNISVSSESGYTPNLFNVNFISEIGNMWQYSNGRYRYNGNITTRNDAAGMYVEDSSATIVHLYCRDVAMTVLPNAPIDSTTGLPIPTIAVATDGGVSVIKDDGSVVDITAGSGGSYNAASFVDFDDNHHLIFEQDSQGRALIYIPIPDSDRTTQTSDSSRTDKRMLPASSTASGTNAIPRFNGSNATIAIAGKQDDQYVYGGTGLTSYAFGGTKLQSSVAYLTSTYNSGYMTGVIKGAWLSDTDTTNVVGTELVTNGTFDTDVSGWSKLGDGATSVIGGQLVIAGDGTTDTGYEQQITGLDSSSTYVFKIDIETAGSYIGISENSDAAFFTSPTSFTEDGTYTFTFTGKTSVYIIIKDSAAIGGDTTIDNISVKLADSDRSVNNNGLQVNGTITKTAVATGADLVGYTDFLDNTNYFYQPPNTDMDFGTGDFSVTLWHKNTQNGIASTIYFTQGASSNNTWQVGLAGSDDSYLWVVGTGIKARTPAYSAITKSWVHLTFTRRSGVTEIWVNGELKASAAAADDVDSNLGIYAPARTSTGDGNDHLALLRISATAPTAAQIKEIYNAEKPLFQENAKATLNGTSDAVQCLAYDDSTELLHVGTSGGRSTFQGLRRVDETATNTTEISAQGGRIIEETA